MKKLLLLFVVAITTMGCVQSSNANNVQEGYTNNTNLLGSEESKHYLIEVEVIRNKQNPLPEETIEEIISVTKDLLDHGDSIAKTESFINKKFGEINGRSVEVTISEAGIDEVVVTQLWVSKRLRNLCLFLTILITVIVLLVVSYYFDIDFGLFFAMIAAVITATILDVFLLM